MSERLKVIWSKGTKFHSNVPMVTLAKSGYLNQAFVKEISKDNVRKVVIGVDSKFDPSRIFFVFIRGNMIGAKNLSLSKQGGATFSLQGLLNEFEGLKKKLETIKCKNFEVKIATEEIEDFEGSKVYVADLSNK